MSSATVAFSNKQFSVSPQGFRFVDRGDEMSGAWEQVASVMTFRASASMSGVQIGAWQHLGVTFANGRSFRFHSRASEAYTVAELTVRYAGPHILARTLRALEAGETVRFGAISMSRERLFHGRRSWPLSAVAGHRAYQGSWMMDVGPKDRPTMKVMVQLHKVDNFFALRAALDRFVPGSDYGDDPPDLGTALRPSASSHDPRYPAGRTRLLILAAMLGVGAIVFGVIVVSSMLESSKHREAQEKSDARFAELVEIAEAKPIAPGTPYKCDANIKSSFDVVFSYRGKEGSPHPGLTAPELPFTSSGTTVGPYWDGPWFVHATERAFTKKDAHGKRFLTLAVSLVDAKKKKVRCRGEVRARLPDGEKYMLTIHVRRVLESVSCAFEQAGCAVPDSSVQIVPLDEDAPANEDPERKPKR